ncbi:MAG: DUF4157 domain-containing protein [Desulfobulbaceae bacterium]|nr:DUF4157 domain-containing protein [Desulfobulbaceae bacterium]
MNAAAYKTSSQKTAASKNKSYIPTATPSQEKISVHQTENEIVQRKISCACGGGCQGCQAKSGDLKSSIGTEISNHINSSRGGGRTLNANTRRFFEPRFGADLSGVRIHTGGHAAQLNRDLSAKAFTKGNDIFFGAGKYQPETPSGKRLIAHELTHVRQGGLAIRRCADKADEAKYNTLIGEIKALATYKKLTPPPKKQADTIIKEGKAKSRCMYYAKKLKILLTTPEKSSKQVAIEGRKKTAKAVKAEAKRLKTDEGKRTLDLEETATADPKPEPVSTAGPKKKPGAKPTAPKKTGRTWSTYPTRFGNGKYKVDATDPANIFVKVKVNLVPKDQGTWNDVKNIKKLEDAIEKHASRKGFILNLVFVNPSNNPTFRADPETVTIYANPKWPNATNWGGNARTNAHELFHVLNFPLDRYNYIESHAANKMMAIAHRLHWFLVQMRKPVGFDDPKSLMGSGQYPTEEDVCTIAKLPMAACLKAREKLKETQYYFRTPMSFVLPTAGYAYIGGYSGLFLNYGLDLGIGLTHKEDWQLFIGGHVSLLKQLEGDRRLAFLIGARLGIEKVRNPEKGGLNVGGFVEGGAALVSDQTRAGGGVSIKAGGYGYGGVNIGYRLPSSIFNISINAELGAGVTSQLGLHDPQTFVKDRKMLPFFTAGIRAAWMF